MFKRFKQVNNKSNILIQSKNDIIILYEMLKEENSGNRAKKKKKKKKGCVGPCADPDLSINPAFLSL